MEALFTVDGLISLFTLALLEIVLGIDNIIFISIIADKLPTEKQGLARTIGIGLALIVRIILLFCITWIVGLKADLFTVFGNGISGRDLILLFGGLFLMAKSTSEIHAKIEGEEEEHGTKAKATTLTSAIIQIVLIDIIFSFDSILTAVGLVKDVDVMLIFIKSVSDFINNHPTLKMLALSFLIMIGLLLVGEALDMHVPKGYVYFAMAFSFGVELLNMQLRKGKKKAKEA
jgi:predicted tellurium resistance membrane protein TerC